MVEQRTENPRVGGSIPSLAILQVFPEQEFVAGLVPSRLVQRGFFMLAKELMTRNPACVTPEQTIRDAAAEMERCDCGCLPVVEKGNGSKVIGVITDRDIAMRAVGKGRGPDTPVQDVMSASPRCCCDTDDVELVKRIMTEERVRRVPVVDQTGRSVGMISQADLARAAEQASLSEHDVASTLEKVSQPSVH